MKPSYVLAVAVCCVFACSPTGAVTTVDVEGVSGSRVNDTLATAQVLGVLPVGTDSLTVNGHLSDTIDADVDFYQFTVAGGTVDVYFDIDLANDVNSIDDDDSGLDSQLVIFDAAGSMIAFSDDNNFFEVPPDNAGTDPGSDPFGDLDPFIAPLPLDNGVYYAALAAWDNNPSVGLEGSFTLLSVSGVSFSGITPNSSFDLDSSIAEDNTVFGQYRLDIRTAFLEIEGGPAQDLDGDDDVDDADFALLFAAFTGPGVGPPSNPAADLDGDNDVDDADFALAFAAFTGPGAAAADVPEPASVALLAAVGVLACGRRRG